MTDKKDTGDIKEAVKDTAPVFSKEQLTKSIKYSRHQDLLNAVLSDDKEYSYKDVDAVISNYEKKEVK